ncbi:hypothetical protein M404DRAFT_1001417 [Pisolithus tinctorius Marx 270]|uniref:C2H2-type domain-containing protein n=1 Tax=Pisolithus tinctorius Marx 270 TaxID=870435 RepID=A0A0C3J339_PISTI|nr:hypothetical protein M404DRAFT_1001417 [Pisolithus tinctorius Marx 270]
MPTAYGGGFPADHFSMSSYVQPQPSSSALPMVTESDNDGGNSSSSADGSQHERRSDSLPADPPTPVTRKSRGRKVPVSEGDVSPDPTRKIKCKMCDCWFCRGEHVKRHIATLHSVAKPYACGYPTCNKTFSRRDNCKYHYDAHFKPKGKKKSGQGLKKQK